MALDEAPQHQKPSYGSSDHVINAVTDGWRSLTKKRLRSVCRALYLSTRGDSSTSVLRAPRAERADESIDVGAIDDAIVVEVRERSIDAKGADEGVHVGAVQNAER